MMCSMCDVEPATHEYGVPVCEDCWAMLQDLQGDLKEMEADDPELKALGERVEDGVRKYLEQQP